MAQPQEEFYDKAEDQQHRQSAAVLPSALLSGRPYGHVITAPLSARAHFEQPGNRADLGGARVHYIDPTDPGHDFLESTAKPVGALQAFMGRVRRAFSP